MSKQYATDLHDAEWAFLEPRIVAKKRRGPKSRVDLRGVINAIFYRLRTGCQWRLLPKEYPNWEKVSGYWQRWSRNGKWEKINADLREAERIKAGKKPNPTAAIIDSQSVKTAQKGGRAVTTRARKSKGANAT
jgi:putative transposase